MPGDIVVGDLEGVRGLFRAKDAIEVLKLVTALMARETKRIAEIAAGQVFKAENQRHSEIKRSDFLTMLLMTPDPTRGS